MPENGEGPLELDVYDFKRPYFTLAMYNVDLGVSNIEGWSNNNEFKELNIPHYIYIDNRILVQGNISKSV
ncbi:Hypothetical predicted protein [Olea europaea subsp. europaea]|uniref:Uncharacterized protein n=1 Tax=Olea europaea subsp. europaea TaxID=158383 RepID=A0A8S0PAI7_OLEEU|nr:Hypothetical predicted protein [Olea europaea subsp. europaea]